MVKKYYNYITKKKKICFHTSEESLKLENG